MNTLTEHLTALGIDPREIAAITAAHPVPDRHAHKERPVKYLAAYIAVVATAAGLHRLLITRHNRKARR
ncbi:hypothetical protein [Streptomyces sp.]|uniref:hypothetical protein n=1 Tax=Streptomyces sp. TaxID=1931 RepID=UPI002D77EE6E|nr:hypothetical protein [Streptomyces sp.]HET6356064.1 hypothetical protein [Streptomyces sp.]